MLAHVLASRRPDSSGGASGIDSGLRTLERAPLPPDDVLTAVFEGLAAAGELESAVLASSGNRPSDTGLAVSRGHENNALSRLVEANLGLPYQSLALHAAPLGMSARRFLRTRRAVDGAMDDAVASSSLCSRHGRPAPRKRFGKMLQARGAVAQDNQDNNPISRSRQPPPPPSEKPPEEQQAEDVEFSYDGRPEYTKEERGR